MGLGNNIRLEIGSVAILWIEKKFLSQHQWKPKFSTFKISSESYYGQKLAEIVL